MERKYPVGIQTFERLRRENYLYIDKTDLVWRMTKESPFVFLSRPRRFGKSLLTTTLDSYFKGEKELFQGLKIMELETEWKTYPVLHFDLSGARHLPVEKVKDELRPERKKRKKKVSEEDKARAAEIAAVERELMTLTGTRVHIAGDENKGKIELDSSSL